MLSCGRIVGRLSKVTRHTNADHFYRPLKYVGIVSIINTRQNSSTNDKKPHKRTGTTIKPEECIPESNYSKEKKLPLCEQANASCPPSCYGTSYTDESNGPDNKDNKPPYWKGILATLLVAGVSIYLISSQNWFSSKDSTKNNVKKKKTEAPRKRKKPADRVKSPATSSTIPQEVPYLLVGGGTAAFSAFRSIKSKDPKAKVLVITDEEDLPYMRPPLSKELWYNTDRARSAQVNFKQWNGTERSLFYEPPEFYSNVSQLTQSEKGGVAVATGWKVIKIDVPSKTAVLEDGHKIKYDKCLLATGSTPKNLPIFEAAEPAVQDKIIPYRIKEDFLVLEQNVHDPNCKSIVIIGGGFLGSELACSLARNLGENKKVYQIFKEKSLMAQVLPEYLSEWTTKKAVMEGVNCIPSTEVEDFSYRNGRLSLILTGDRTIEADQVVTAVGADANTDLAGTSYLEVDPEIGGFLVNAELEARSNLWVAGDAACFYDVKLGRRRVEHHDHAVISGRLAGENMTGAGKPYLHQSMFWSDLGPEVGYEAIGIIDSSLPTVGVFAKLAKPDAPLETISVSDEGMKSTSEEKATKPKVTSQPVTDKSTGETEKEKCEQEELPEEVLKQDDYAKGVIFYLRNDVVVGIVLWNIFNRMSIARQVLARDTKYDELNEVAKLFTIHDD